MKRYMRRLLSLALSLCIAFSAVAVVGAEGEEVYISDMKLIYADTYDGAVKKLADTAFEGYTVLDANLNSKTGKTGVWLCYKTTTDIEEALTDVAAMYMDGGYNEGSYQAMIEESRKEYEAMSLTYLTAVDYFAEAYGAGDFLAECAYRQLNLYGDREDHPDKGLGEIFADGIDAGELATIFMEGNVHVLKNVRSLLAQGCAYNESGLTYLETVTEMAALYEAEGAEAFEDFEVYEELDTIALLVSATITTFGDMMRELAAAESELNYLDDEVTDAEIRYMEYVCIAEMLRETAYTDGVTLYDFCLSYTADEEELEPLYPLAAALNKGQVALTKVCHYYDVVRYSMTELPEELMEKEIAELEEQYGDNPFDVYTGTDRSIFDGTFALTTEAYRADAYTESGFEELFTKKNKVIFGLEIGAMAVSLGVIAFTAYKALHKTSPGTSTDKWEIAVNKAAELHTVIDNKLAEAGNVLSQTAFVNPMKTTFKCENYDQFVTGFLNKYLPGDMTSGGNFMSKFNTVDEYLSFADDVKQVDRDAFQLIKDDVDAFRDQLTRNSSGQDAAATTTKTVASGGGMLTGALIFVGGVVMILSAVDLCRRVINYYNPDYSDVPVAMVDMRETEDGDRYIKYDAVNEATERDKGKYIPGDTNGYKAQRWVALYTTKSYEAGRPLLAQFNLSTKDRFAKDGYLPVHLFGEEVCFDLSKYNFSSGSDSIYLSVKQSENNKAAVTDVPQVVGTMIGGTYFLLAAGAGVILGVGIVVGAQRLKKKDEEKEGESR